MSFSADQGYVPVTIDVIMLSIMDNVNAQFGTSYTADTFVGTNFYKYFYALAQRVMQNEIKTSEIFVSLQQYFDITNEKIDRPVVTSPGIVNVLLAAGYEASVKPLVDADAGKVSVCVNVNSGAAGYSTTKLAINTIISNSVVAGAVTQGTETSAIVLSNGQSFNFKYYLPNLIAVLLRLTITLSVNNRVVVDSPDNIKLKLYNNIKSRYGLGLNFEPQKYFNVQDDAPWASDVKLEWSTDAGSTYHTTVYSASFNDLYNIQLANITLVEA